MISDEGNERRSVLPLNTRGGSDILKPRPGDGSTERTLLSGRPVDSPILRVALFLVGYFAILFVASIPKGMVPPAFADLVWGTLSSIGILGLTVWLMRREQRDLASIGLQPDGGTALRLIGGVVIGCAVYALTLALISVSAGPIRLTADAAPGGGTILLVTASFIALSCMEELGFRAYPLRTLAPTIGVWPAQLLVAVAFGLAHMLFGWAWQPVLLGVIPSALLFGAAAMRSGGLALPIGIHAALNVALWSVGEKGGNGLWRISVDEARIPHVSAASPFIGVGVLLVAALVIAMWPVRPQAAA